MACCDMKRRSAFLVAVLTLVFLWTLVLPRIGSQPSVRSRIEFLNQQGIDPAALYYTDLEVMESIAFEVAAVSQAHPEAFWAN